MKVKLKWLSLTIGAGFLGIAEAALYREPLLLVTGVLFVVMGLAVLNMRSP